MHRVLPNVLISLFVVAIAGTCLVACDSDEGVSAETSGLFGPCGDGINVCQDGLACLPGRDDPTVFMCTRGCVPAPKCPDAIAVGECRALLECGQGCCEVNNIWTQSGTTVKCGDPEEDTKALLSDGYCQPWP